MPTSLSITVKIRIAEASEFLPPSDEGVPGALLASNTRKPIAASSGSVRPHTA
ncbi:hypothetical protein [Nonomuraea endophytica]|uniref:Uncharacterized protein n=1 Tax=Nonomuraea endophytica TaxID=714136 RepID=A0A7W8A8V9_9ACTN|nr:hypothetical protein [Nonomuraea endophytica]MBB5081718.1 hypothetical protein [Nonomuraea endophytica]